ncbi:hypothetical protein MLD38_012900 [Melastoma candidum]|uniref:Uncharacterized protein n=1 Tax=Melastoma candidum TaxID=119954 RepID=A0ACB9R944_9MYRT|nr:hypothetical protein MLD38_012900 [Melastoma candidum]
MSPASCKTSRSYPLPTIPLQQVMYSSYTPSVTTPPLTFFPRPIHKLSASTPDKTAMARTMTLLMKNAWRGFDKRDNTLLRNSPAAETPEE